MRQARRFHFSVLALLLLFLSMPSNLAGQAAGADFLQVGEVAHLYPPDGDVDRRFPDRSVFFDTRTQDVVLAYRTAPGLPRAVHRIELPIHVAPIVVASVSQTPEGGYRYRYLVANGPSAKQAIHRWFLSTPRPKAPDPTKPVPPALKGSWQRMLHAEYGDDWTLRFDSRTGTPLAANRTARFIVDDEDRPGFVEARFQGGAASHVALPSDVPQAVREQFQELIRMNSRLEHRTIRTIGPKYGKRDFAFAIASDFLTELRLLVDRGALDANSPFVRAAAVRLEEFVERPRPWLEDAQDLAVNELFPPIGQSANPLSSAELQFETALDLALVQPRAFSVER